MQTQQTERVFRHSGELVLPDPDPLEFEAVRQVCASPYPEIITAAVSGQWVDGKEVLMFKRQWAQKPELAGLPFRARRDRRRNEKNALACEDY